MSATATSEAIWFIDNLAHVRVRGADTSGAFCIVEMRGRRGDMPPLHVHEREDEAFYVLEGRMTLHVPGATVELAAGDAYAAKRGIPHVYRVDSDEARWLAVCSPAGFDEFVCDAGEPAPEETLPPLHRPFDPGRLAELAASYGIEIVAPPGTLPAA
jgi:quercetin dioxygenase-like cupin family protein